MLGSISHKTVNQGTLCLPKCITYLLFDAKVTLILYLDAKYGIKKQISYSMDYFFRLGVASVAQRKIPFSTDFSDSFFFPID